MYGDKSMSPTSFVKTEGFYGILNDNTHSVQREKCAVVLHHKFGKVKECSKFSHIHHCGLLRNAMNYQIFEQLTHSHELIRINAHLSSHMTRV